MVTLREVTGFLESLAPVSFQESYDNSGLQVGDPDMDLSGALVTLDVTEQVVDEAIHLGYNLILSHHPLLFGGIKSVTGKNAVERILIKAVQNDLAIYSGHTNFDSVEDGVNRYLSDRIGLHHPRILEPVKDHLYKLVVFIPVEHLDNVRTAMFEAGAGHIGEYDRCSFTLKGKGTFRGSASTHPFVGEQGKLHTEPEARLETIVPDHLLNNVISGMIRAHPYEEVAYDIYPLKNAYGKAGMGMIGELEDPMDEEIFMTFIKDRFQLPLIRHTELLGKQVRQVAVCGGAGSFLLGSAIRAGADVFITGDFKYHQFFEADRKIVVMDIGHFESEQFTRELFYDLLIKKFPKFAVRLSEINTNPIKYF